MKLVMMRQWVNDDKESSCRSHYSRKQLRQRIMIPWKQRRKTAQHLYSWVMVHLIQRRFLQPDAGPDAGTWLDNVFIGTVEGEPEDTACEAVIEAVKNAGYKKVVLRPLMVVAGDHANNDMAGDDDDSWKSQFVASGNFDSVDCQIAGLGEIPAIQDIYVAHTAAAIK